MVFSDFGETLNHQRYRSGENFGNSDIVSSAHPACQRNNGGPVYFRKSAQRRSGAFDRGWESPGCADYAFVAEMVPFPPSGTYTSEVLPTLLALTSPTFEAVPYKRYLELRD